MIDSICDKPTDKRIPHLIMDNIWTWSVFSEEKGIYFNGHAVLSGETLMIIDPPSADEQVLEILNDLPELTAIIVTNKDHERESFMLKQRYKAPIWINAKDAGFLEHKPDEVFQDGDRLYDLLEVIELEHQKSPGESALWYEDRKLLILGDALIGKPAGSLSMLPTEKYINKQQAFEGLKSLLQGLPTDLEKILVGDGESIMQNGYKKLENFFEKEISE